MKLPIKSRKNIALLLGIALLLIMFTRETTTGIWLVGIPAMICSIYYAYLVCRYELMEK